MRPQYLRHLDQKLFEDMFTEAFIALKVTTLFYEKALYKKVLERLNGIDLEEINIHNEIIYKEYSASIKLPIFYICISSRIVNRAWIEVYYSDRLKKWDARYSNANTCAEMLQLHIELENL